MTKVAVAVGQPISEKKVAPPVTDPDLKSSKAPFRWSLERADYRGRWGFDTKVFRNDWCVRICRKLKEFEKLTWGQLANQPKGRGSGTKHHHVSVKRLTKKAKKRLQRDLEWGDIEEIYSLRLDGKTRIYGVVIEREFNIIWYDPNHEVLPIRK